MTLSEQLRCDVIETIAAQLSLNAEDITEDSRIIDDLGADSLDIVELSVALEDKLSLEISDSDIMKVKTVSDIFDFISDRSVLPLHTKEEEVL